MGIRPSKKYPTKNPTVMKKQEKKNNEQQTKRHE